MRERRLSALPFEIILVDIRICWNVDIARANNCAVFAGHAPRTLEMERVRTRDSSRVISNWRSNRRADLEHEHVRCKSGIPQRHSDENSEFAFNV